VEIEKAKTE